MYNLVDQPNVQQVYFLSSQLKGKLGMAAWLSNRYENR